MSQEEVTIWERENKEIIMGWEIDYVSKPEFKIITFTMTDKTKQKFEVEIKSV